MRTSAAIAMLTRTSIHRSNAPGFLFDVGVRNLDFDAHYLWAIQFAEGLRNGDVYPHWMWRGYLGLGEVALLFYSPLFYYVCSAVRLLTPNTWDAMRIVFVLSTILSCTNLILADTVPETVERRAVVLVPRRGVRVVRVGEASTAPCG